MVTNGDGDDDDDVSICWHVTQAICYYNYS